MSVLQKEEEQQKEDELLFDDDDDDDIPSTWDDDALPSVPVTYCRFFYIFVGLDKQIQQVQQETVALSSGELSFSFLHQQLRQRTIPGAQYKLLDTLVFDLDVDHDEIPAFLSACSLEDAAQTHLRILPFLNDITLHDAPLPLHEAHSVYFVLLQKESSTTTTKQPKLQILEEEEEADSSTYVVDLQNNKAKTKRYYGQDKIPFSKLRRTRKLFHKN